MVYQQVTGFCADSDDLVHAPLMVTRADKKKKKKSKKSTDLQVNLIFRKGSLLWIVFVAN